MTNSEVHQEPGQLPVDSMPPPYERRYRWVMLGLIWVLYVIFGIVTSSLAPLVTTIIKDLKISYSQMGLILGAWPLTYVAVAIIGGAVVDRLGIRRSIFFGVIIIGLSEVLRGFAGGFGTMFLCVALFGFGGPMLSIGSPKTISLWFRGKERGTAVGIYLTGVWIGMGITLATMNSIIMPLTGYNWRIVFIGFGLLAFAVALLWWFLARDIKPAEAAGSVSIGKVFGSLISVRNVRLVLIMGFLSFSIGHGISGWLPKILEAGGLSPAMAGLAASIPVWIGVPTVIVVPRLVAPHLRGRVIALLAFVVAMALLTIATTSGVALIAGLVFYGLFYCCILPLLVLVLMELPEVGSKYMGAASGMFFCVAEIGGFAGPLIIGTVKDLAGGFLVGTCFLAGLSLIRVVVALSLRIKHAHINPASP